MRSAVRDVLRRVRPDLVHAGPIQDCAFLVALVGFQPLLTMSWGFDLMQDIRLSGLARLAAQYALKRSTCFTSDAEVTRDKAVGLGMRPDRTRVIPWGVDLSHFRPRTTDHQDPRTFTILCNRAWEPRYGVEVLARAFVEIAAREPRARLLLMGAGSGEARLRRILGHNGTKGRVEFVRHVPQPDLLRWYHRADLFVSPSHVDGSSVSLMEAMACGLPVLASDIPGNKEWIQDGANGWLYPDGDSKALALRALEIARAPQRMDEIGRRARETSEQKADWKRNAGELMRTYDEAYRFGKE